jgi:hypothetical protein
MTISGISSASVGAGTSDVSTLDTQKAKLDAQIRKVTDDKSIDAKTKEAKLEALQAQKAQLQAQIDRARQQRSEAPAQTAKADEPSESGSIHVIA